MHAQINFIPGAAATEPDTDFNCAWPTANKSAKVFPSRSPIREVIDASLASAPLEVITF